MAIPKPTHNVPFEQRKVLTIDETCAYLHLCRATVYKLLREGRISARKLDKRTLILRSSLDAMISALPPYERESAA
jgi:excisionase family DNA binding protein